MFQHWDYMGAVLSCNEVTNVSLLGLNSSNWFGNTLVITKYSKVNLISVEWSQKKQVWSNIYSMNRKEISMFRN